MSKKRGIIMLKNEKELITLILTNGFTLASFSKEIGCSPTLMTFIVRGERSPSPKLAQNICTVLKKDFEDIFFIAINDKSN